MSFDAQPAESLVGAMNRELAAVSPDLVGNSDLLRGILSGCGDCIKVLDLQRRRPRMSDGGKRVMEVDDFSLLQGCPWPDFWADEGNAQAIEAVAGAAKAGQDYAVSRRSKYRERQSTLLGRAGLANFRH